MASFQYHLVRLVAPEPTDITLRTKILPFPNTTATFVPATCHSHTRRLPLTTSPHHLSTLPRYSASSLSLTPFTCCIGPGATRLSRRNMDFTPPPGLDISESKRPLLFAIYSLTYALALVAVFLRLYCRMVASKAGLWWDDYLICIALVRYPATTELRGR